MTDTYGPFDGEPFAEAEWYTWMTAALPSGVIGDPAASATTGELAFAASGLNVSVGTGKAVVGGAGFERTGTPPTLAVTSNGNASHARRDRLVLRRDLGSHDVTVARIQGTAAASPTAPAITRTDTVYDLKLFSFLVPANNGTTITSVIDERTWIEDADSREGVYATTSDRDASISSPTDGMVVYVEADDCFYERAQGAWRKRPGVVPNALLHGTGSQSLASSAGTFTAIVLGTQVRASGMSTTLASGRITATVAGIYLVSGAVAFDADTSGRRYSAILKNGTLINESQNRTDPQVNSPTIVATGCYPVDLAVGDYVQLGGLQDTGSALNAVRTSCFLQAHWIGPS